MLSYDMLSYDIVEKIAICADKPGNILMSCKTYSLVANDHNWVKQWLLRHVVALGYHPKYLDLSCKDKLEIVGDSNTALVYAIVGNDERMVSFLLDKQTRLAEDMIYMATYYERPGIVKLMLEHQFEPKLDEPRPDGPKLDTAMYIASLTNNIDIFKLFLGKGARVSILSMIDSGSAIVCRILYGNVSILQNFDNTHHAMFRLILEASGSINRWHVHAVFRDDIGVLRYLLDAGADVHTDNDDALRVAVSLGKVSTAQLLIDEYGATVLPEFFAVSVVSKRHEMVRLLMGYVSQPRRKKHMLNSIVAGDFEMVKLLFDKKYVQDCIMEAVFIGDWNCVRYFVSEGGRIGFLLLFSCFVSGDWEIFKIVACSNIKRFFRSM